MGFMFDVIKRLARNDEGQDLIEYALLVALIVIGAILGVSQVGEVMTNLWWGPIAQAL